MSRKIKPSEESKVREKAWHSSDGIWCCHHVGGKGNWVHELRHTHCRHCGEPQPEKNPGVQEYKVGDLGRAGAGIAEDAAKQRVAHLESLTAELAAMLERVLASGYIMDGELVPEGRRLKSDISALLARARGTKGAADER